MLGAQGIAGLRYFFTPNVALFAEGKYLHAFNVKWFSGSTRVYTDFDLATSLWGRFIPLPASSTPPRHHHRHHRRRRPATTAAAPRPEAVMETIVLQSVHFEFDQSRLTPLGRRVLDEAAQKLQDNPRLSVVIEGNTDSIGTDLYNLGLGQRRAEVGHGVSGAAASGRSEAHDTAELWRIAADCGQPHGGRARALNRRVEFKVLVR